MNVLITGISGFLGSNLAKALSDSSTHFVGITQSKKENDRFNAIFKNVNNLTLYYGDLSDYNFVNRVVSSHEFDYVFHLGAVSIVRMAESSPLFTYNTNIMGTVNILEALRKIGGVKGIVVSSSDKYYGQSNDLPYVEKETLPKPHGVYETSKTCTDFIAQSYGLDFGLPVVTVRCCNLYGEGDFNTSRLIPNSILRMLTGKAPFLWSDAAEYVREFIYIRDAVNYLIDIIKIAEYIKGTSVNIGTGAVYKIKDFVSKFSEYMEFGGEIEIKKKKTFFKEIPEQSLDTSLLKDLYIRFYTEDSMPKMTTNGFEATIENTVEWYKGMKGLLW